MISYRRELWFNVPIRRAFVNITSEVEAALKIVNPRNSGQVISSKEVARTPLL